MSVFDQIVLTRKTVNIVVFALKGVKFCCILNTEVHINNSICNYKNIARANYSTITTKNAE